MSEQPAASLNWTFSKDGLPIGIQIIGPRGGDAATLSVAREIEALLAANPETARPVPDLTWLRRQPPISGRPGFLDFD